jgi:hypothetical protein
MKTREGRKYQADKLNQIKQRKKRKETMISKGRRHSAPIWKFAS